MGIGSYSSGLINYNSVIVAIMLCSTSITMIPIIGRINGIVVLVILISSILLLLRNRQLITKTYLPSYLLIGVTLAAFAFNIIFNPYPVVVDYLLYFICFGIPFLLLPISNISVNYILRTIVIISLIFLPFYASYDYGFSSANGSDGHESEELMTMSYRILPLVLANAIVCLDKVFSQKLRLLSSILLLSYCAIFFVIGSRGALVALIAFFFIYSINYVKPLYRIVVLLFAFLFIILSVTYFERIISVIYEMFASKGVSILAVERMMFSIVNEESLDSGRTSLYLETWANIKKSPIIGNGIGSSLGYSGYPHNVFLQVFDEGGIAIFIPFLLVMLKGIKSLYVYNMKCPYVKVLLFVFCSGIIQLFFSFHYWGSHYFWTFVYLILYKNKIIVEQNKLLK